MPKNVVVQTSTGAHTARDGQIWIQPKGCGSQPYLIGCVNVDELSIPKAGIEFIKCFDPMNTNKYITVGSTKTAPDDIEFDITGYVSGTANWIDHLAAFDTCPVPLMILIGCKVNRGVPTGWARAIRVEDARISNLSFANLTTRSEDNAMEQTATVMASTPNTSLIIRPVVTTHNVEYTAGLWDIAFCGDTQCGGPCGDPVRDCETGFAIGEVDGTNGAVLSEMMTDCVGWQIQRDSGNDPVFPFAATEDAVSLLCSRLTGYPRLITVRGTADALTGAEIAYSDDNGINWVNVGVTSLANQIALGNNALTQRHDGTIWLALSSGYICYSLDNGATWDTIEGGVLMGTDDLYAIHFRDDAHGLAGGENGKLLVTDDAGEAWYLLTDTADDLGRKSPVGAGVTIKTIYSSDRNWFIGTSTGKLYRTQDFKVWHDISFNGQLTGSIDDIEFYGCTGVLVFNEGGNRGRVLYSVDGFSWEPLETPPNNGLRSVKMLSPTEFFVAGDLHNGHGIVMKGTAFPLS